MAKPRWWLDWQERPDAAKLAAGVQDSEVPGIMASRFGGSDGCFQDRTSAFFLLLPQRYLTSKSNAASWATQQPKRAKTYPAERASEHPVGEATGSGNDKNAQGLCGNNSSQIATCALVNIALMRD